MSRRTVRPPKRVATPACLIVCIALAALLAAGAICMFAPAFHPPSTGAASAAGPTGAASSGGLTDEEIFELLYGNVTEEDSGTPASGTFAGPAPPVGAPGGSGTLSTPGDISTCQVLNTAGTYRLTANILGRATTCFTVTADDVDINLALHTITGDGGSADYGVYSNGHHNLTVRRGTIANFSRQVYAIGVDNLTINNMNMTADDNIADDLYGIVAENGDHLLFNRLNISRFTPFGPAAGIGLLIRNASDVRMFNIRTDYDNYGAFATAEAYGIYLSLVSECVLVGHTADFCDTSLFVGNSSNCTISEVATSSSSAGLAIYNCNNLTVSNVTSNSQYVDGVLITDSSENNLTNITATSCVYGVRLVSSTNNTLTDIAASSSSSYDLLIGAGSNRNLFVDSSFGKFSVDNAIPYFKDTGQGEIRFLEAVSGTGTHLKDGNANAIINLSDNLASVRSDLASGFDKSANITLYGTPGSGLSNPAMLKDGYTCTDCHNFTSLTAETVIFNVTGFTNYTLGEASIECNPPVSGNWTIANGTHVVCDHENITVDGDIYVKNLSSLTLIHSNLTIKNNYSTQFSQAHTLEVTLNSSLIVNDSRIAVNESTGTAVRIWGYSFANVTDSNLTSLNDLGLYGYSVNIISNSTARNLLVSEHSHNNISGVRLAGVFAAYEHARSMVKNAVAAGFGVEDYANSTFINCTGSVTVQESADNLIINHTTLGTQDITLFGNVVNSSTRVYNSTLIRLLVLSVNRYANSTVRDLNKTLTPYGYVDDPEYNFTLALYNTSIGYSEFRISQNADCNITNSTCDWVHLGSVAGGSENATLSAYHSNLSNLYLYSNDDMRMNITGLWALTYYPHYLLKSSNSEYMLNATDTHLGYIQYLLAGTSYTNINNASFNGEVKCGGTAVVVINNSRGSATPGKTPGGTQGYLDIIGNAQVMIRNLSMSGSATTEIDGHVGGCPNVTISNSTITPTFKVNEFYDAVGACTTLVDIRDTHLNGGSGIAAKANVTFSNTTIATLTLNGIMHNAPSPIINFTTPLSTIATQLTVGGGWPVIYGYVDMPSTLNYDALRTNTTNLTRYYPVLVYNRTGGLVDAADLKVYNASNHVLVYDGETVDGLENPGVTYYYNRTFIPTLYQSFSVNASWNPSVGGLFGILNDTPIILEEPPLPPTCYTKTSPGVCVVGNNCSCITDALANKTDCYAKVVMNESVIDHATGCANFSIDDMTLDCNGSAIDGTGAANSYGTEAVSLENITLENCVLTNWTRGMSFTGVNGSRVRNNTVAGCTQGIFLTLNSVNNTVAGNNVSDNEQHGIGAYSGSVNNTVQRNTLIGNGATGMHFNNSGGNAIMYNNLTGNNISISIEDGSPYNDIYANRIRESDNYGIVLAGSRNTLYSNYFEGNDVFGIFATGGSHHNLISGNSMSGSQVAIWFADSSQNNITTNNITYNSRGITLNTSAYNLIAHNRFINQTVRAITIYLNAHNNTIDNNTMQNAQYGILFHLNATNNTLTNNNITHNSLRGVELMSAATVHDNNITSNFICYNGNYTGYDIKDTGSNPGDENWCDATYRWNDTGALGCTYKCTIINITKSVNDTDTFPGRILNFTINVTNLGIIPVNVSIDDLNGFSAVKTNLPPGATWNLTYLNTTGCFDINNTVNASGRGPAFIYLANASSEEVSVTACGDGVCNCGEDSDTCLADCPRCYTVASPGVCVVPGNCSCITEALANYTDCYAKVIMNESVIDYLGLVCVNFSLDDTTLDCNGSAIDGPGGLLSRGINATGLENITVENCAVNNWSRGIYLDVNASLVRNNTATNNTYGIFVEGTGNNVSGNRANVDAYGIYLDYAYDSTVANNTACYDDFGISVARSSHDNITDNMVCDSTLSVGISLSECSYLRVLRNDVHGDWSEGMDIGECDNSTVAYNNVSSNEYGIVVNSGSANITIANNTASNNTYDGIGFYASSSGNMVYNNTVEFNGVGVNFTSVATSGNTLVLNRVCFNTLDIQDADSNTGDNNTCDTTEHWNDTGTVGCTDPCTPRCYSWDGAGICVAPGNCSCITEALADSAHCYTKVVMNESVITEPKTWCANFSIGDMALDCNGSAIDGLDAAHSIGILAESLENISVENCIVTDWEYGILMNSVNRSLLSNDTVTNCTYGTELRQSSHNAVSGCNFSDNVDHGMLISECVYNNVTDSTMGLNGGESGITVASCHYCLIANSTFADNTGPGLYVIAANNNTLRGNNVAGNTADGVYLDSLSSGNTLDANYVCFNGLDINDSDSNTGDNNTCDTFDNWWDAGELSGCTDYCTPRCYSWDGAGVCETPGNCSCITEALADSAKCYNEVRLNESVENAPDTCAIFGQDDVLLNCSGYAIDGAGTGDGVRADSRSNISVKECNITDWETGVYFYDVSYGNISGNVILDNTDGIYLDSSPYNYIGNNTMGDLGLLIGNSRDGISAHSSDFLTAVGNTIGFASQNGILLDQCDDFYIGDSLIGASGTGIDVDTCANGTIAGCNLTYNGQNMWLGACSGVDIIGNSLTHATSGDGIRAIEAFNSYISLVGNNITDNDNYGIEMATSDGSLLVGNTIVRNGFTGIMIIGPNTTIVSNNVSFNGIFGGQPMEWCGIFIFGVSALGITTDYSNISLNTADNNTYVGILAAVGNDLTVSRNTVSGNAGGIGLLGITGSIVQGNNATYNLMVGIAANETTNSYYDNLACFNGVDMNASDANPGDDNRCDTTLLWDDDGTTNCTLKCTAVNITKTVNDTSAWPNRQLNFTINVTNIGIVAVNVSIDDTNGFGAVKLNLPPGGAWNLTYLNTTGCFDINNTANASAKGPTFTYLDNASSPEVTVTHCGDLVVNCGEACDGNTQSCTTGGYPGTQTCSASCTWNACVTTLYCNDSMINGSEECDNGSAYNGVPCTPPAGGSCVYCSSHCANVTLTGPSPCRCGDSVCNCGETCHTCEDDCGDCYDCSEPWVCDPWSPCVNGLQSRVCGCDCGDKSDCHGDHTTQRSCGECTADSQCSDANPCTSDACTGGACVHNPLTGASCTNGDACAGDTCQNGACVPAVCPPPLNCTATWLCTSWGSCASGYQTRSCTCSCPDNDCAGDRTSRRQCVTPPEPCRLTLRLSPDAPSVGDTLSIEVVDGDGKAVSADLSIIGPDGGLSKAVSPHSVSIDKAGTWQVVASKEGCTGDAEELKISEPSRAEGGILDGIIAAITGQPLVSGFVLLLLFAFLFALLAKRRKKGEEEFEKV